MAKLVILTEGLTGLPHELSVNSTTVGRAEGNLFQIIEPSVSGRHCEILLRGNEVVVRDLKSTNGTFIQGERITEAILKPGQVLRLGRVDLRLQVSAPVASPASGAPAPSVPKPPLAGARTSGCAFHGQGNECAFCARHAFSASGRTAESSASSFTPKN